MPLSGAAFGPSVDDQPGITPGSLLDLSGYVSRPQRHVSAAHVPFLADTPT
jgi:hypothetical protein